jgi:hypothetical protein
MKKVNFFCLVCITIGVFLNACNSNQTDSNKEQVKESSKEKFCTTYSIALNKVSPYYEGQWQGIGMASDGACYFGSSCHSLNHGGGLFRFDPSNRQFDVLSEDLSNLVNTDFSKNTPQGKVHCPIIEFDGSIYLTTHLAAYWDDVLDKYEGSHLLSYKLATKKWRDFGVIKPRWSTYSAIEVDSVRGKVYAMECPFSPKDTIEKLHLYQIDIKSGEKRDLGQVPGDATFWFYLDNTGKLWFTSRYYQNRLYCYNPETDKIKVYEDAFPPAKYAPDGKPYETDIKIEGKICDKGYSLGQQSWTWVRAIDGGKRCLYTFGDDGGADERLWVFDPSKDIASKEAFTPICYIGNTFLSVALANNRVFYVQMFDNVASRGYDCEFNRDIPADQNGYQPHNLRLRSVALDPKDPRQFIDHGRIIDQDGRTPAHIASLAADSKGNIFMNGSWLTKPGDIPSIRYMHNQSAIKKGKVFETLKRGEFFAYVNVTKDLK